METPKQIKKIAENYNIKQFNALSKVPDRVLINESDNLYHWVFEDKDKFDAVNFDWNIVLDIPNRIKLLNEIGNLLFIEKKSNKTLKSSFNKNLEYAKKECNLLYKDLKYALLINNKNISLEKRKQYIKDKDVSEYLSELSAFAQKNIDLLKTINFDFNKIDKVKKLIENSALTFSNKITYTKKQELYDYKKIAYLHLYSAINKVRQCGLFLFKKSDPRYKGYICTYKKDQRIKRNNKKKNSSKAQELEDTPGDVSGV